MNTTVKTEPSVERGFIAKDGSFITDWPEGGKVLGGALRIGDVVQSICFADVNQETLNWLFAQGVRHTLGDATANAATLSKEDGETRSKTAIAIALAARKVEALKAGQIRTASAPSEGLAIGKGFDAGWTIAFARAKGIEPQAAAVELRAKAATCTSDALLKGFFAKVKGNAKVADAKAAYDAEQLAKRLERLKGRAPSTGGDDTLDDLGI